MCPASSAGLTIRLPDDRRARLFRRASFALERLKEAVVAVTLLLTTIGMSQVYSDEKIVEIIGFIRGW